MTHITINDLERMPSGKRVCEDARDWFTANFPNGAELREAWYALKSSDEAERNEWLVWFSCHWLPTENAVDVAMFSAGVAMRHAGITEYADNVTRENALTAAVNANAAADAAADATRAAAHAAYAAADATRAAADATRAAAHAAYAAADAAYAATDAEVIAFIEKLLFGDK